MLWNICLVMQRCVAFFYIAFVSFCEAVLRCLSKTPDWANKELSSSIIARQEGERMGEAGRQRENRRRDGRGG
ncbi:hypothetical protein LEMLEM_LOCUS10038 [Lemmus lemmus]